MGWDAISNTPRSIYDGVKCEKTSKAFKDACDLVKIKAGSVDGMLSMGMLVMDTEQSKFNG